MENRRALITGATGFIGSHLVRKLLQDGWSVHIIARKTSNLEVLELELNDLNIHYYDGTIEAMRKIMDSAQPLTVFHLASLFIAEHQPDDITALVRSNIEFGTHLVQAMVNHNVKYLINTGTSWQHYQSEAYNPVCLYAATKQAYEDILKFYVEAYPLKVVNLKLFDSYGPNDRRKKLFSQLAQAENSVAPIEMSEGNQLIDLVYIDDIINAFLKAQQYQLNSQTNKIDTFAVSSRNPMTLKEIVSVYCDVLDKKLLIDWGKRSYRKREVMVPWDKGTLVPGWFAQINLEQGIKLLGQAHKKIGAGL